MKKEAALLSGHSFLTSLTANPSVFADEIDKFHYLKSLKDILDQSGWHAASFVLLDDELDIVLFSKTEEVTPDEMLLTGFHQVFLPYFRCRHCFEKPVSASVSSRKITDSSRILETSLRLHFIPKRLRIVSHVTDYWWSSIQTYQGNYRWDFIEPQLLFTLVDKRTSFPEKELNRCSRRLYQEDFGTMEGYSRRIPVRRTA